MHVAEAFMQAFLSTLATGMPTITVVRDDSYLEEVTTTEKVNITQGDDIKLSQNVKYFDSELTINVDIFVTQRAAASPVGTLLNARRAAIVQAITPSIQGSKSLGVFGAYNLREDDSFPPVPDHTDRPVADMRMLWKVNLRRDIDDPETII